MQNKIGDWRPLNEAHSIRVAGITLKFGQDVTDIPWKKALADGREAAKKAGLGVENAFTQVSAMPTREGMFVPPVGLGQVRGVEFLRMRTPAFADEKMNFDRNSLHYESWDYTRWAAFLDRALMLLFGLVERHYLSSVPFLSVTVDYFDTFVSVDGVEQPDVASLLSRSSGFVTEGAFRESDPWHVHSGWSDTSIAGVRRLLNVDIDVHDTTAFRMAGSQMPSRAVNIRTAATDQFDTSGGNDAVTVAFLKERLQMLHDKLKSLIGRVLTDEAALTVGLRGTAK